MNNKQLDAVLEKAKNEGIGFLAAMDAYLLHGTGEEAKSKAERAEWNAQVEAKKQAKTARKKMQK